MRLFRVDNEWGNVNEWTQPLVMPEDRELLISSGDQGPGVYFAGKEPEGDYLYPPVCALPVGGALELPFKEDQTLKNLRLTVARLVGTKDGEEKRLVPSTPGEVHRAYNGTYYGPCLMHVCIPILPAEVLLITANSTEEWLEPTGRGLYRVMHRHHGIAHAAGVEVVAMNEENTEAIFRVWPQAAFRIFRSGAVLEGESPELLVTYDGRMPRVIRPRRYLRNIGQKAKRWGFSNDVEMQPGG